MAVKSTAIMMYIKKFTERKCSPITKKKLAHHLGVKANPIRILTLACDSGINTCDTSSMLISIWDVAFKWVELLVSHTHTCF
jgi:hypothetical protein